MLVLQGQVWVSVLEALVGAFLWVGKTGSQGNVAVTDTSKRGGAFMELLFN